MTDHATDVAAVLMGKSVCICDPEPRGPAGRHHYACPAPAIPKALAALTAANYAVVRLPEGVAVEHGARLVPADGIVFPAELEPVLNPRSGLPMYWPPKDQPPLFAIEPPKKECPTCSGPIRETVGMVCQTCGTDYAIEAMP